MEEGNSLSNEVQTATFFDLENIDSISIISELFMVHYLLWKLTQELDCFPDRSEWEIEFPAVAETHFSVDDSDVRS